MQNNRFLQCALCPAGSWSEISIATKDNCTSCGPGRYSTGLGMWRGGVCTSCLSGTYSEKLRAVEVSGLISGETSA
jgi:hypothetical protein